jgi:predicted Zn-dependent peptidase
VRNGSGVFDDNRLIPGFKLIGKKSEQAHVALAVKGLPKNHEDEYAFKILNVLVGGNMSSRLFNEIREERGLAYEISSVWKAYEDTGSFMVEAGLDAGKLKVALKAILGILAGLRDESVSARELKRAKDFFMGQLLMALENSMDVMLWAGEEIVSFGSIKDIGVIRGLVEEITPKDIRNLARKLFTDDTLNCAVIAPLSGKEEDKIRSILTFNGDGA